jgi:hypothetical protein
MTVLTENTIFLIEVLDELGLFVDEKVIFVEKKIMSVCSLSHVVFRIIFFPFNLENSPFRVRLFELKLSPVVFEAPDAKSVG